MRKLLTILTLLAGLAGLSAHATPVVQSGTRLFAASGGGGPTFTPDIGWTTSGTMDDGQVVTLTRAAGIGGTVRTDERPLVWYPFSANTSLDTTNSRNSALSSIQGNAAWQSTVAPYAGAGGALDQTFFVPSDSSNYFAGPVADIGTNGQAFVSYYVRWNYLMEDTHAGVDVNNKMIRIWDSTETVSSILMANMFVQSADVDGIPTDGTNASTTSHNIPRGRNTWWQYEHLFQESSAADVADGVWQHYVDGGAAFPDSNPWTTRKSGFPSDVAKRRLFLSQLSNASGNNQPPSGSHLYISNLYVSDTLLHVLISNETSYTTTVYADKDDPSMGHPRETQLMRSTGNNSTTLNVLLRAGQYTGSLPGKCIFVVNSLQTRRRVGCWSFNFIEGVESIEVAREALLRDWRHIAPANDPIYDIARAA
jgi:hypothetical protein